MNPAELTPALLETLSEAEVRCLIDDLGFSPDSSSEIGPLML